MSWANHTQIQERHFSRFWQHSASLTYCSNKCCQVVPMKNHTTKGANPQVKPCKLLLLSYQGSRRTSWVQHLPHTVLPVATPFRFDVWINTKVHPMKQPTRTNGKEDSTKTTGFPQTWHKAPGTAPVIRPRPPAPQCCSLWCSVLVGTWVSSVCLWQDREGTARRLSSWWEHFSSHW